MFKTMQFIGGGRITRILLERLKNRHALPEKVIVIEPDRKVHTYLKELKIPELVINSEDRADWVADLVFIAVHPPVIKEIMADLRTQLTNRSVIISLAPVVKMSGLQQLTGGFNRIVRLIPNAPSLIGEGYNPVCFSKSVTNVEKETLRKLFNHWGETPEVTEDKLEAYAILIAMGPTYFWFQWLKLQELGKQFGMNNAELNKAMPAMLHGAIKTLFESNLPAKAVLNLIPVCPLKEDESVIQDIFDNKLTALYTRLTQK